MIVVNMWFIKHTNGLFHYGLDYAEALGERVRVLWVRDAKLAGAIAMRLPDVDVKVLTVREMLSELGGVRKRGDLMFTPSSHPLAPIRRQIVVMHDSFPFVGGAGKVKLLLFLLGLAISGSMVAYINRAEGRRFLRHYGLTDARLRYLPNRIVAPSPDRVRTSTPLRQPIVVGLFGSDSPKKNYDALFTAFGAASGALSIIWRIYGHENAYTDQLRSAYPELKIEIVDSDSLSMEEFTASIDLVVSVARGEGFARPIASALMRGTPACLLDTPVFREFYSDSARFFTSAEALASYIAGLRVGDELAPAHLASSDTLRSDFSHAVAWLESYDAA